MSLLIEEETEIPFDFDYKKTAEDVVNAALKYEHFPFPAEVSLTITDEDNIHSLNKQFRNIDRPTDVLSFPMLEFPAPGDFSELKNMDDIYDPENNEVVLGDIVLCVQRILSQAKDYGHSVMREYAFLIAHSMLHLMGYDHMKDDEREDMEKRQREILERINITRGQE